MQRKQPLAVRPATQDSRPPVLKVITPDLEARARILVVDDDEHNLLAIRTVLEDVGEVVVAKSGEEALRALLRGEFAVILLDVYMPGMDGYEVARMIRGREQTKRIPIIFLSAVNKETEHLIRGYSMGAVDYVFKPVEPIVLQSKVAVFVDLFLMTREIRRKAEAEQELLDATIRANAERLRAERELRLAEQRQSAIIQSLPILLYLETEGVSPRMPKLVSGDFTAMTGLGVDEIRRTPTLWHDRLHPEDRERVEAALKGRGHGAPLAMEYRWQHADGRYRHVLDQAVPLREADGKPMEYAGTLLDVTERKDLETQLLHVRKMDAIGKLTGGIAHDFNNLLAAVIGGLGMIERRVPLDEEHRKILAMTQHAAGQGTELVSRLLAFARKQRLEPAAIDLTALAGAVDDLLSHTLGGLVEIAWDIEPDVAHPYADEAQLELALMNLAINARDAMPDGGTIHISAREAAVEARDDIGLPAGRYVVLTVADAGCGIAPDLLERVMEPFFTTKDVGKGTGLGLSMVYGFANQSGGTVRIESCEGDGTRVELWLPRSAEGIVKTSPIEPAPAPISNACLNILLVDDHEGVRATTAALLEDLGHLPVSAEDGPGVLDLLGANPDGVDLIISDYAMPHVSGAEVIRRARQIRPALPAIIITGYADSSAIDLADQQVVAVNKPFTPAQMKDAIARAMEAKAPD
ncbi:MAG: hybrid sensor histidine kinase/response regulator [Sphingomonas bacterium]|uniref:response regulator n=1 Tax=Sphingomonas bacterium TaxID=1895847 RepID=UPI00260A8DD4|nr:response regulator [Sphingomonas bacterium]MDB5706694.1 hybrid sensor histidine kinase/response regulator [Sphingomonas bacterium]